MNNRATFSKFLLRSILLLAVLSPFGCNSPESDSNQLNPASQSETDDLTADEILSNVLQQYSESTSYQDKAVLYLSYRLNGKAIQEPHPWSVAWNRNRQFAGDWFNSQIRCDGKNFSCYVYDISTGNVDNQQLWLPVVDHVPLAELNNDSIASHFIFGTSELPLDESEAKRTNPLVQPMVGFFQYEFMRPWLASPEQKQRLPNASLDEIECYRIQLTHTGKKYVVWINKQSAIIEQIELPIQYLHSDVLAAEEITQLNFLVRYHDAQINEMIPPKRLITEKKLAAKTVRRFVELPEALPSEMIGEKVSNLVFTDRNNKTKSITGESGNVILLWLSSADPELRVKQFEAFLNKQDRKDLLAAAVYSDEFLIDPLSGSIDLAPEFTTLNSSKVDLLYDRQLRNSMAAKIKALPCVTIFNKQLELQYARAVDSQDWLNETEVALSRIENGENIAQEMRLEYQKYLDQYHQQIAQAEVDSANSAAIKNLASTKILNSKIKWDLTSMKNPGNVYAGAGNEVYCIDGFQTVVRLDISDPDKSETFRLELPEGAAVNRLRSTRTGGDKQRFVLFSLLGRQAFVFDNNFNRIAVFPENPSDIQHNGLTECAFTDDGQKLLCSFIDDNGLVAVDIATGETETVFNIPTKTFCAMGNSFVHVIKDRFALDNKPLKAAEFLKPIAARSFSTDGDQAGSEGCLLVGTDAQSVWHMMKIDKTGTKSWSVEIGDQFFDSDIEPINIFATDSIACVSVASSRGMVQLFDRNGELLMTKQTGPLIRGCCIGLANHRRHLIVSAGSLKCWPVDASLDDQRSSRHVDGPGAAESSIK